MATNYPQENIVSAVKAVLAATDPISKAHAGWVCLGVALKIYPGEPNGFFRGLPGEALELPSFALVPEITDAEAAAFATEVEEIETQAESQGDEHLVRGPIIDAFMSKIIVWAIKAIMGGRA